MRSAAPIQKSTKRGVVRDSTHQQNGSSCCLQLWAYVEAAHGAAPEEDSLAALDDEARFVGLLMEYHEIQQQSGGRVSAHLLTSTISRTQKLQGVNRKLKVILRSAT
jgi:hypothetical protein